MTVDTKLGCRSFRVSKQLPGRTSKCKGAIRFESFRKRKAEFTLQSIPALPKISHEFETYLASLKRYKKPSPQKPKSSKSSRSVLNGFIAFRAFHSRGILEHSEQIELSRALALFWEKEEKGQTYWKRYASEYTHASSPLCFVDWLCEQLHLVDDFPEITRKARPQGPVQEVAGTMEDLFQVQLGSEVMQVTKIIQVDSIFGSVLDDQFEETLHTNPLPRDNGYDDIGNFFTSV